MAGEPPGFSRRAAAAGAFELRAAALLTQGAAVYSLLTMAIETEVKFRVDDIPGLTRRLEAAGFHEVTPRTFESNVLYDTPDRQLRARIEIVRLRNYGGKWILTHKRVPEADAGSERHKHRIETETEVSDGEAMAEVFRSLGLVAAFRYEKWRSEWADGEGHCVVDETPIGGFAELEGASTSGSIARPSGWAWSPRST